MNTRRPVISGKNLIKFLEKQGWRQDRQKGSHVILIREVNDDSQCKEIVVPLHKEIKRGTLSGILKTAGISNTFFMDYFLKR